MSEKQTNKAAFVLACVKCATLNRVEAVFNVEPAKTIGAEDERKEAEKNADGNIGKTPAKDESGAVRSDPAEGKTDSGDSGGKQEDPAETGGAGTDTNTGAETTDEAPAKGTRRNRQHKKGLK